MTTPSQTDVERARKFLADIGLDVTKDSEVVYELAAEFAAIREETLSLACKRLASVFTPTSEQS